MFMSIKYAASQCVVLCAFLMTEVMITFVACAGAHLLLKYEGDALFPITEEGLTVIVCKPEEGFSLITVPLSAQYQSETVKPVGA